MRVVLLVVALVVLAACGGGDGVRVGTGNDPGGPTTGPAAGPQPRYTATDTVLESPEHGPQLCLGMVAESYPPQCGGPDVVGWDWDLVDGDESANGTTWGTYTVVGTWDGEALTLTEPPRSPEPPEPSEPDRSRFSTPCVEPEGGWAVVDPSTATDEAMHVAIDYARSQPDVGGVWLDQSINPASAREPTEESMNDPTKLILNVTFTADLDRHETAIRARWGGPLCVSAAPVGAAELAALRAEVESEVGELLSSGVDEVAGRIEIGVVVDDGLQARLDERHGAGRVVVHARLRPVDG